MLLLTFACKSEPKEQSPAVNTTKGLVSKDPQARAKPSNTGPCAALCKTTATLGCTQGVQCESHCGGMFESELCRTQLRAFLSCSVKQPPERFECDRDTGVPALKPGVCEAEQDAVVGCMERLQ